MNTNALILSDAAAYAITEDVARFGARSVETGGFLLAPRGTEAISTVALAGTRGIVRRRDLFQIGDLALDSLFGYVDEHDLWIPAQYHSHGREAFMSPTDVEHGLSVEGFVSTIVPFYAAPPTDPADWAWWRYEDGWGAIDSARLEPGTTASVIFDEGGVRAA